MAEFSNQQGNTGEHEKNHRHENRRYPLKGMLIAGVLKKSCGIACSRINSTRREERGRLRDLVNLTIGGRKK
jgi:hypothetical protein